MSDGLKQELIEWGMDWEDAKERFLGDEELILKFEMKMLKDNSMNELTKALEEKDAGEAFKAAHTLKGVAANLSLKAIEKPVHDITEILRKGELSGTDDEYEKIKEKYDELMAILEKHEGEED